MPFADYGKTKTTTGFSNYGVQTQDTKQLLESLGYAPKESLLQKLGSGAGSLLGGITRVLRTGEFAVGGLLKHGNPLRGIKEQISPSEALMKDDENKRDFWSKENLAGFVIDTLLDPVTYLTFGASGAMKLSTKGGTVAISKGGEEFLKDMISKGVSQGTAKKALAKVIQEGGDAAAKKYIGKSGLKFMGKVFVPAKQFQKAGELIGKVPILGKTLNKVGRGVAKAFIPFSEIDQLPVSLGGKGRYSDDVIRIVNRESASEISEVTEAATKLQKQAVKEAGKDVGREVTKLVEKKGKQFTVGNLLDDTAKMMKDNAQTIWKEESGARKKMGKGLGEIVDYIRHKITKEGSDFLEVNQNALTTYLPKQLRAKLDSAKTRNMKGTIEEINKYMSSNHGVKKFFEDDAFKLFAQRNVEHIKFMNAYKIMEGAKQFGVKAPKGVSVLYQDGIKLVKSSNPLLKDLLFAEPIIKHLDGVQKVLTNEETLNGFVKMYDKVLNVWKASVTGLFPAFHTRNYLGGTFNNYLGWTGSPITMVQENLLTNKVLSGKTGELVTKTGTKYTTSQLLDLAKRFGVKGQPGMADILRDSVSRFGKITTAAPLAAMEFVEDRLRLPLFFNGIREGLDPAEAAKNVFKYHFDYNPATGLTDFERIFMKRVMPFYTWTRNNIPLQIEQLMKQPGKYAGLDRLKRTMTRGKDGELADLPSWMQDQFTFPLPLSKEIGKSIWVSLDLPANDINKLPVTESGVRAIASQLTPFLKFPLEKFFNRNMYFGGDIVNPDLPPELQTEEITGALTKLPEPIRKFLGIKEVSIRDWNNRESKTFKKTFEVNANNMHLLNSFLGRYFSTMNGLSDEDVPDAWKASKYLGGVPIRDIDIGRQRAIQDSVQERQYSDILTYLKQHNIVPYADSDKKKTGFGSY